VKAMKIYEKPVFNIEHFVANEYISACSDIENKYYVFRCDAGGGETGDIYLETNRIPGLQKLGNLIPDSWKTSSYHACGKEHYVKAGETFPEGYFVGHNSGDVINVLVWQTTLWNGSTHATTDLIENIDIIQGNKS